MGKEGLAMGDAWLVHGSLGRAGLRYGHSRLTLLMKTYMCLICGWIYDEAAGFPDDDIAPGTAWDDIPITWTCPECGAQKSDFEMVEL